MNDKIEELFRNQNHILEAVKNLNERLETIEEKYDDQRFVEVKEILKSQTMIYEIIVNNSDDIALMLKVRDEHENAMQLGTENVHA